MYDFTKRLMTIGKVITILGVSLTVLFAGQSKDTLVVTAQTDSNGFSPTLSGNSNWFYASTIPSNTVVADTIPIQFAVNDDNGITELTPYTISLTAAGQIAAAITFDTTSFPLGDGQTVTHYAYINTTGLAPGDYTGNIKISGSPQNALAVAHAEIHLTIHVADPGAPPTCYISDSEGLQLTDCAGKSVSIAGTFLVVSNAKKITATNPGQFYYNLVWQNSTGSDVTFSSVALSGTNVVPVGTNSVHVLVYDASQFTANFDDVNTTGIPCGQTGTVCKAPIVVPAGQTIWLTWHVAYQWIGSSLWPDIPATLSCPLPSLHGTITMSALLQNDDQSVSITCGTNANGYSK